MKKKKPHPFTPWYRPQLPIDSRLIPNIFSFSHVRGVARVFLFTEMVLSTLVVIGTVALVFLKIFFV